MSRIIDIEVALNFLNNLYAESVACKDEEIRKKLGDIRQGIYYGDFDYSQVIEKLKGIKEELKKYE